VIWAAIGRVLSILSIPLMGLAIWGLIRQVRHEQPMGKLTPVIGLVMAPLALAFNLVFMRPAIQNLLGPVLLLLGLGFGLAWGQTTKLFAKGETVVARRSILHLIFWGLSYALTQVLATFAPATWVAGGLAALLFSTGATLGTHLNILVRRFRVRPVFSAAIGDQPLPERPGSDRSSHARST